MKYNDHYIQEGESRISKRVMERIRQEEPWLFPQDNQLIPISYRTIRVLTAIGILLLTLSLVLFLAGLNGKVNSNMNENASYALHQITGVGEIGYVDSKSSTTSLSIDDMVASIGDAFMISGNHGTKSLNFPLLVSVFIFFEVLLLMNWITRYPKA